MATANFILGREDTPEDLAAISADLAGKEQVIIYFHGGLSSPGYVEDDLGPELLKHLFQPRWFPDTLVCFVQYEASLFAWEALESILKEILTEAISAKLKSWIEARLGLGDKLNVAAIDTERKIQVRARSFLEALGQENSKNLSPFAAPEEGGLLTSAEDEVLAAKLLNVDPVIAELDGDVSMRAYEKVGEAKVGLLAATGVLAKALIRTFRRIANGTHHDYFVTVVEEVLRSPIKGNASIADVAQGHWKMVKEHAKECWEASDKNGYGLLDLLADEAAKRPSDKPLRVDLMCHSAGSITLCAAIDALARERAKWPQFQFGTLLLVAPAVQLKVFQESIADRSGGGYFEKFRMYTLTDEAESTDKLAWYLYANSLLYFVSGVAEEDGAGDMMILGMERHFKTNREPYNGPSFENRHLGSFGRISEVRDFLAKPGRVVLSPQANNEPGKDTDATGHENSKRPIKSPRLAASLVHVLTGDNRAKFSPTEFEIKNPPP